MQLDCSMYIYINILDCLCINIIYHTHMYTRVCSCHSMHMEVRTICTSGFFTSALQIPEIELDKCRAISLALLVIHILIDVVVVLIM